MANITYTVNENSPETILGVEQYLSEDTNLITSFQVNSTFIPTKHLSELHILTLSDDLIESDYSYNNYKLLQNAQSAGTEGASVITVDPVQDVKLYGYDIGGVKLLYHFLNNLYGEGRTPIEFYIDSISPDRTEVRLNTLNLTSEAVLAITTEIVKSSQNRSYQDEFRLNFKNNDLLIVVNINSVQVGSDTMVAIKLYEPLPLQYGIKSVLSIVEIISDSIAYQVSTRITEAVSTTPFLRTPNFDIEVEEDSVVPTGYFNYDELFSYPINNSNSQIFSTVNEKGIDISIDYSDFNNFIQFSSAQERLLNFKYKADLLNSYTVSKATLSNSKKGSSGVSGSRTYYEGLIEGIVNNFDHYERHLYYESGSTSWPKSNNTKPYTINLTSTSWYEDKLKEAAAFDDTNNTSLISTIPTYLREDANNQNYLTFVYMIGQHFDNLWVYTQAVTDKYNADNRLHSGISKDLVAEALKNFGVKLYTSNKSIEDLFTTFIGQSYQSGKEQIKNYVVASSPDPLPVTLPQIKIGTQIWTTKDLDTATYRNGDPIPQVTNSTAWANLTTGAWCYRNNDPTKGKLYNWYAVSDPRGIAPQGYHVPTTQEWNTLITFLGGTGVAGGKMKSTGNIQAGTGLWQSPNTGATNSSGFTGFPGESRNSNGTFSTSNDLFGNWWSSTNTAATTGTAFQASYLSTALQTRTGTLAYYKNGFSVRLIFESPSTPIQPTSLDDYQKDVYKRIYHNLPLLLKSKGTERGLRALINCFGISSDILDIKLYGGRNVETTPFFGDYTYSTGSLDKVRIDHTGSLLDENTLSLYTSNYKREDKYTDDLHAVEVGFSPSDNIDQFIISSSLANAQLTNFNIDNYIGDPRDLTSSTYTGLSTIASNILGNLKQYDVTDYIRLIKFFDNTVFKMVRDFIPARASVDTGVIIKPHILNRNKAKSVKASVDTVPFNNLSVYKLFAAITTTTATLIRTTLVTDFQTKIPVKTGSIIKIDSEYLLVQSINTTATYDELAVVRGYLLSTPTTHLINTPLFTTSTTSINNAFNYTSSIDTAYSSGSDGGVFGSKNQLITSPGYVKYSTPLGKTIKQTLVEDGKYTGELPNSKIVVSTGELNSKNLFKNTIPTTLTFNIKFYEALPLPPPTCTLPINGAVIIVQPRVQYNLPEYFITPGGLLPENVVYKIGTTQIPATSIGSYVFNSSTQYIPITITADAGTIGGTPCNTTRTFKRVSCDLSTKQTVIADYINRGQTYNLTTFFNTGSNTEVDYTILINSSVHQTINSTIAKAYIFPTNVRNDDNFTVQVKDAHDSNCTTSISFINKVCPLGPEPGPSIFYTTVTVAALTSTAAIIPNDYFIDNLVGGTYYYRESTTTTTPTGDWPWILKTTAPSVAVSFTSTGRILQLKCVNYEGCEKIIQIEKEVGVNSNKVLTDIYWSDNIKQACNLGNVQGTGQLPAISDFYYIDNVKTPIKTLTKILSEYKLLYRITGSTSTLFTGAIVYNFIVYVVINGRLSRTISSCDTYNNPL